MLDVLIWYLWAQAFALGGSLVAARWLRHLPDGGYGLGKALGILLGGFAYWLLVTIGFSQNNTGAALLALAVVWATGIFLHISGRNDHSPSMVNRQWSIVVCEVLFALGFVAWAVVRAYSPEIQYAGGEKFMESMMINAILRSPTFPPNDAWMSGFSISYYYFGYVMLAMLTRLSGVAPAIGFNIGGAMIFALTLTSAYSVGYNLRTRRSGDLRIENADATPRRTLSQFPIFKSQLAGILTAFMLALMGNMGGIMGALKCTNALPAAAWEWLDIRDTATQTYSCRGAAPDTFYGWWWDWSRVVKDTTPAGQPQEVITESPIFSFVLGDNHPHVMALPFVLIALGMALAALTDASAMATTDTLLSSRQIPSLGLSAIVLGGLSFMNTWDFPVYGTIFIAATLLGRWLRRDSLIPGIIYSIAAIALGYLIYIPFYATFSSQAQGISINVLNGTRLSQFFMMFAPFLVAALGYLLLLARETARTNKTSPLRIAGQTLGLTVGLMVVLFAAVLALGAVSSEARTLLQQLQTTGEIFGVTRDQVNQRLLERATNPWLLLTLGGGAALCAVLVFSARRNPIALHSVGATMTPSTERALPYTDLFVLVLIAAGALLTLSVEFVFLRDLFGTRMNTVFKFYYIGWVLWAVGGGYAVVRLLTTKGLLAKGFGIASGVFVLMGLLWPAMAVPARAGYFENDQPTLDGANYMKRDNPADARMIDWLNANVVGDAHIVEASTLGAYDYKGRISAFTGLPAALGWGGHQHQWRGDFGQAAQRNTLVEQLYKTTDPVEARSILDALDIKYVIVGDTERATYPAEGFEKFETLCTTAFSSIGSTIYQCN